MSKIYQIKDWREIYENNKSRERQLCSFSCIPNKQDGLGYGMLMLEENGEALYGAFVAIVLVCSKQTCGKRVDGAWKSDRNGWLTADGLPTGCPLTARQLSVKCKFKETTIQKMLDAVSSNEIGWIDAMPAECPPSADTPPAECPHDALEGKGKNRKKGEEVPPALKLSERISFEKELVRLGKELEKLGSLRDHDRDSKNYKRHVELTARQIELRKNLGVTA